MGKLRMFTLCLAVLMLGGCGASKDDYTAVYQVVPDAHVFYLGNHYFLAKDNDGGYYFVKADGYGEAAWVQRLN